MRAGRIFLGVVATGLALFVAADIADRTLSDTITVQNDLNGDVNLLSCASLGTVHVGESASLAPASPCLVRTTAGWYEGCLVFEEGDFGGGPVRVSQLRSDLSQRDCVDYRSYSSHKWWHKVLP
ncbi:MAG: hypothetical protein AB7N24_05055 [Dehalococcoidia bacterium]